MIAVTTPTIFSLVKGARKKKDVVTMINTRRKAFSTACVTRSVRVSTNIERRL